MLKKSIIVLLEDLKAPVITDYSLGLSFFQMDKKKKREGKRISESQATPEYADFLSLLNRLLNDGILSLHKDFPSRSVYTIFGRGHSPAEDIICAVNPLAFVSHLSAMDYHGLTDRNPRILYISAPSPARWTSFAEERMKKDLGEDLESYLEAGFPRLKRIPVKKVNNRPVQCYSSVHLGAFKNVLDRPLRVATLGRTFLDMIRVPALCGGIEHILHVYQEHAVHYLDLIVNEINRHGKPIDKVRAGYILEEVNQLQHPLIQEWEKFIRRGGSRKLDPTAEYAPVYSQKWCISINTVQGRA